MTKNRVVVTGMGVVSPVGIGMEPFWHAIKEGTPGFNWITLFDTTGYEVRIGAEVKEFVPQDFIEKKEYRRMDRYCQFAMAATKMAVEDASIDFSLEDTTRAGVLIGTGVGGLNTMEYEVGRLREKGPNRVSPLLVPMMIANMASGNVAIRYGLRGVCTTVVTACATGTNAIGDAYRLVAYGQADVMICGGAEAPITPISMAGFAALGAMTKRTDMDRLSIPFDKERDGFVIGEGAGVVILETLEHATKRGARIYAEVIGYGSTCDAYHMTAPDPEGMGAYRCMDLACKEAQIDPCKIDYINAHGTSTYHNDRIETMAIKKLMGEAAYKTPISSTKSMTGHMLGAAGAVEAIICIKTMEDAFIPPTIGYRVPDEECDLDYVTEGGRNQQVQYTLSNSFGFGGHNASLVIGAMNRE